MKRKTINRIKETTLTIGACICFASAFLMSCKFNASDATEYRIPAQVVSFSSYYENVTVEDNTGNLWQFKGTGYNVGDELTLLMDSNGTDDILDDIVLEVRER